MPTKIRIKNDGKHFNRLNLKKKKLLNRITKGSAAYLQRIQYQYAFVLIEKMPALARDKNTKTKKMSSVSTLY